MTENVAAYPAEIKEINGSATGPWAPAPASTFTYTVEVCTDDGNYTQPGVKPLKARWPDAINCDPIQIGTLTEVFRVGDVLILNDRELPHFAPCQSGLRSPGGGGRGLSLDDVTAALVAATPHQRAMFRKAVGLG